MSGILVFMNTDNHIHIILDGKNYAACIKEHENGVNEDIIRGRLGGYASRGITRLRDGGDNMGVSLQAKKIAGEYGIDYLTPGYALHKKGYYGDILGKGFEDERELEEHLEELKRSGADFVKLMASGIMSFSEYGSFEGGMISEEEITSYISVIKSYGFAVMVHVNSDESVRAAILAGADSIEHGFFMSRQSCHLLYESGCVWVPTICAVGNLINNPNLRGAKREVLERIVREQIKTVEYAMNINCHVALGTDAGSYGVCHEDAVIREENFLMECSWDYKKITDVSAEYLWNKFGGK